MPRSRFRVNVAAPDAAALQAFRDLVQAQLPPIGKIFDKPFDWNWWKDEAGLIHAVFDARFKNKVDGMLLFNKAVTGKTALAGTGCTGRFSIHDCPHDDPVVVNCRDPVCDFQEDTF